MSSKTNKRAVAPSPPAGEGWREGAASEPVVVREGAVAPYLAKPQPHRHSREGGNPTMRVEHWPFERAAIAQSDRGRRMKQRDYLESGALPVIDQGQEFIGGYTDDKQMTYDGELPVVLFGDHTRAVKFVDQPFAVGADGIKTFRPTDGLLPKYFYYWMKSARLPDRGYGRHYQFLRKLSVPVPHLDEQRRIVAELETQLTRLDASVTALKRVQANLKRYRASVLKAACEGRLVPTEAELARPGGRSYESGSELLSLVLEERRKIWSKRGGYKEPRLSFQEELKSLPKGWAWASVDQLTQSNRPCAYGVLQPGPDTEGGVPLVRVGDIDNGKVDQSSLKLISPSIAAQYPRTRLRGGEVAISLVGAIGRTAVIPATLAGANTARAVGVIP